MKLFSLPDGAIDRKDRAQWLSCPFDLGWGAAVIDEPGCLHISDASVWSVTASDVTLHSVTVTDAAVWAVSPTDRTC